MNSKKENESVWRKHPIVIFTGILALYTVSNSIIVLFNL